MTAQQTNLSPQLLALPAQLKPRLAELNGANKKQIGGRYSSLQRVLTPVDPPAPDVHTLGTPDGL